QDANLIGKSLTVHTVASFEAYLQKLGQVTVRLTKEINQISQANNEEMLAEKGLIWHIGLYPMLSTDNKKNRIKTYAILTLVHYNNNNEIDKVCNYRDSAERIDIYKNCKVPVYDLGHVYP